MMKYIFLFLFAISSIPLMAQETGKYFTDENKVAIKGYDLVNYFTNYSAIRGSAKFSTDYDGVTFYFVDEDNKQAFLKSPDQYLPAYGGYCAFGLAKAQKPFPVDPETFKIVDGKLYFFFNDFLKGEPFNTIVLWNQAEEKMRMAADKAWSEMQP